MKAYTHPNYRNVRVVEIETSEIDKVDFAMCKEPRETLGSFYNRQARKPEVLINGGLFNMANGKACFNFVDDSVVKAKYDSVKWGIGTLNGNNNRLEYGSVDYGDWNDFISGYPVLLDGTGPLTKWSYATELNYNARRTMMGYNKDHTKLWIVTVDAPGMAFVAQSKLMFNLGCHVAINLDGGGSTRMFVKGRVFNNPSENRSVDNVVAVYLKAKDITPPPDPGHSDDTAYTTYTAVRGNSWWGIAAKFMGAGSKYKELIAFNNLPETAPLNVGQTIKIPCKDLTYTVKAGDSWWLIASKQMGNGTKCIQLAKYNGKTTSSIIRPGDILRIPT